MCAGDFKLLGPRWALFFKENPHLIPDELKQPIERYPGDYQGIIFGGEGFLSDYDREYVSSTGDSDNFMIEGVTSQPRSLNFMWSVLEFHKGEWHLDLFESPDGLRRNNDEYIFAVEISCKI